QASFSFYSSRAHPHLHSFPTRRSSDLVRDPELKFGYAVTGVAKRKQLLLNSGARAGDRVFLTKPLGTGILSTALKQHRLEDALTRRLTEHMATLNRAASEAAVAGGARPATALTAIRLPGPASQLA